MFQACPPLYTAKAVADLIETELFRFVQERYKEKVNELLEEYRWKEMIVKAERFELPPEVEDAILQPEKSKIKMTIRPNSPPNKSHPPLETNRQTNNCTKITRFSGKRINTRNVY